MPFAGRVHAPAALRRDDRFQDFVLVSAVTASSCPFAKPNTRNTAP